MNKTIFFLLVLILFIAFNNQNPTNANGVISLQYDTIQIPITERHLQNYIHIAGFFSDSLELIYAHNSLLHSIDVFDITNRKSLNTISLEREGPDGVNDFGEFTVCDSVIYLDSNSFYYGIDFSGKIKTKLDRNKIANFSYGDFYLGRRGVTIVSYTEMFANCASKAIPVQVYKGNNVLHGLGYIRFDSGVFEMFDVDIPNTSDNYGHLEIPQVNWLGDYLIYNFPYSSSIYVYSIKNGTQKEYKVNSVLTKNTANKLSKNANIRAEAEHQMFSLQFLSVKYDPFRDLYYRVHIAPINNTSKLYDREMYLTVMDNQFNCLKEFKLPQGIFSPLYVITKKGIIFQLRPGELTDQDENIMYLLQVNIE